MVRKLRSSEASSNGPFGVTMWTIGHSDSSYSNVSSFIAFSQAAPRRQPSLAIIVNEVALLPQGPRALSLSGKSRTRRVCYGRARLRSERGFAQDHRCDT